MKPYFALLAMFVILIAANIASAEPKSLFDKDKPPAEHREIQYEKPKPSSDPKVNKNDPNYNQKRKKQNTQASSKPKPNNKLRHDNLEDASKSSKDIMNKLKENKQQPPVPKSTERVF